YTLTREDVLGCVKFPDAIARGCYDIDVHNPSGTGTEIMHLPENEYYTIPMRSLWNPAFSNLIVTGRPISSDHAAHSSLRASIGEAAGILAAQAVGRMVSNVPYTEVQARLKAYDALY
ncbi:MAG: FAD-dependent oxidoreductase, partial [Oscillospiraceae bacterium]